MFGLGKKRSAFGKFIDKHGISQDEICKKSGLNKDTVSKACSEDEPKLRGITKKALVNAANKATEKKLSVDDFW